MSANNSGSFPNRVSAIAIVGGTHGNELTGVQLVKHWQSKQQQSNFLGTQYPALQIETLLANEPAIEENKRYLSKDLNRCFKQSELLDPKASCGEQKLAKQINQMLGPKGESRVDLIIDLHTSTAKMETNLVLIKLDYFHLMLAAYVKHRLPNVVITSETSLMEDHHFLCSIADKSLVIEVGPIPQGSLDWTIYNKTEKALKEVLEFVELFNTNQFDLPEVSESVEIPEILEIMSYFEKIHFPIDQSGKIKACIHPDLVGKDYSRISKGTPIFKTFDGEDLLYDGVDAHIAFVNEAAYYDQNIAMCLCNPISYDLKTLKPIKA